MLKNLWVLKLLIGLMQLRLVLNAILVPVVGPSMDIDSFACGCGRISHRRGDLTRHQWFCGSQLSQPAQLRFNCGCGCIVCRQGDLIQHQ